MKKHLKYIDDTSDKFWQIEVKDLQFTVMYGKNGTLGVTQTKMFDSNEACIKAAEKLLNEKIKKGYSEDGTVKMEDKIASKSAKISTITEILAEYDTIIKQKNTNLILPFLIKNAKGNLDPIRKHIKKSKRYWMTFVDLSLEPGYKKPKDSNWNWGIRGDEKITEIITLSAIATFDKNDILAVDEVKGILEKAAEPLVSELLNWSKPKWIELYLLDKFKKQDWFSFDYKSLRYLESKEFIAFNPELYAFSFSRYNSWNAKISPRDFITSITTDDIAYKREIPLLFEYETFIHNSTFREEEVVNQKEISTWTIIFKTVLAEEKLDRNSFIENVLLIQTKDWNNNLKSFFRKVLAEIEPSIEELIQYQETIFAYFNYSSPIIVNYGSEIIKKIALHPQFKIKSYLEWVEGTMMRSDCKLAVKNTLMIFEKLVKNHPKSAAAIALLVADVYIIADLNLQERATKLLLKIGNEKNTALAEKLASYSSYMQGSIKPSLGKFLTDEQLITDASSLETYQFNPEKVSVLSKKVVLPKDWNDIMYLIGRFIASDELIDAETILNVFVAQKHLFPEDYSSQLQPYLKQLESTYFEGVLKNFVKNMLVNKIANKDAVYKINDKDYATLNTLKLIKPLSQKVLQKNKENSVLPLLSLPTHLPYWVEPKTLLERLIQYQDAKEEIDPVDFSIAISRMPRENTDEALPLLDDLEPEFKDLMRFCLGITNEVKVTPVSVFSKLFQKVTGFNQNAEKVALWAVAARTFHPNTTFDAFEKTSLNDIPFVTAPFIPQLKFKEKWNEWKNYHTKELERSTSWMELTFTLPTEKNVPPNLIYNLDLHPKKEKHTWYSEYVLTNENNVYFWNSIMPQNNEPLACMLLNTNCKTSSGTNSELKGFIHVVNQAWFRFSDTSLLIFACCFFQEKKELRLLASEVLVNLVENKAIDIAFFSEQLAFLMSNKYGPLLRLIDAIVPLKDISPLHNSALFFLLDGIFKNVKLNDKLPTNFKKMLENFVDLGTKTNHKPDAKTIQLLETYKENASLKSLIKQIA
jgi:predicted DNA-binding WGR domain protein